MWRRRPMVGGLSLSDMSDGILPHHLRAHVRWRLRQRARRVLGNWIAAITALIGEATDFAAGSAVGTAGPSPSHHVGSSSAEVSGIALSTLLRPHSHARSMDSTEGARFAGDSVGSNRTRW